MVSLGCPKALVDSERIAASCDRRATTSPKPTKARTSSSSTPAASSTARRKESLATIGDMMSEQQDHRHRHGERRAGEHHEGPPESPRRHRDHTSTKRSSAPCTRLSAQARPVRRSGPRTGPPPDAAPLRLPEDFRGLQQPLLVLHHPVIARRPRQPSGAACSAGSRKAETRGRQGTAGHPRRTRRPTASTSSP